MKLLCPKEEAVRPGIDSRFSPNLWPTVAPLLLNIGFACLALIASDAMAEAREATEFSVPTGFPDEYMQDAASSAEMCNESTGITKKLP